MLAVILESGEPTRLYTALSLLVSTAVEGEPAVGLLSHGALPAVVAGAVDAELWAAVAGTGVELWACPNAGDPGSFEVMSVPRFLTHTAGARLVVV